MPTLIALTDRITYFLTSIKVRSQKPQTSHR